VSKQQEKDQAEDFGAYHPEAAQHAPFNDAMAAWRNQVAALQSTGVLPGGEGPQPVPAPRIEDRELPEPTVVEPKTDVARKASEKEAEEPKKASPPAAEKEAAGKKDAATPKVESDLSKPFDPNEHNAPEVMAYLDTVDEAEQWRVLELEKDGRGRKGILIPRHSMLARKIKREKQ